MALSKIRNDSLADTAVHGRRNLVINGAMTVDQRNVGASSSHSSTGTHFMADRFPIVWPSSLDEIAGDVQQVSDAPDGFSNSIKWTTTTPETTVDSDDYIYIDHKLEAQNLQHLEYGASSAKSLTLSFYVKSSQTGTFAVSLYAPDGSRNIGSTYAINSASTWERKTITFAGDTGGTINDDNGEGLRVVWHLAVGSTYNATDNTSWAAYSGGRWGYGHVQNGVITTDDATWQLTGVQLEVGDTATPFEHRSYGEELSLCHRYFQKDIRCVAWNLGSGDSTSACSTSYHTPMRTTPSVTRTAGGGLTSTAPTDAYPYITSMNIYSSSSNACSGLYDVDAEL